MEQERLIQLELKMAEYFRGHPKQIQHFVKVRSFARLIGLAEGMDAQTLFVLEAAALVHDIGIREAERRFGRCDGELQEELGPPEAERLLKELDFESRQIERVCWLVGHHHTYSCIDTLDYRVLVEADFLVNAYEGEFSAEALTNVYEQMMRTHTGRLVFARMFDIS